MSLPADNYIISRDANEAERLEIQHKCMISCQGYYLHPEVILPIAPRIAELATGTAIWLRELAPAHPQAECHGFDLSDKMFPAQDGLPPNVKLHTADIKKPFDDAWLGYFDAVHIRLIQAAMRVEEWGPLVRNVVTLLKPGGWVQWYEDDRPIAVRHCFRPAAPLGAAEQSLRASGSNDRWQPPPHLATLASFNRLAIDDDRALAMNYGYMNLDVLMKDPTYGNLEQVMCDGFIVDRDDDGGQMRKAYAVMGISAVRNMLKWREEAGQRIGNVGSDEWSDGAMKDIELGAHFVSRATCFIGRKKLHEEK